MRGLTMWPRALVCACVLAVLVPTVSGPGDTRLLLPKLHGMHAKVADLVSAAVRASPRIDRSAVAMQTPPRRRACNRCTPGTCGVRLT
jgi:hypothetical protein